MIDIATANTKTIGEKAGKQVTAATVEKIRRYFEYCYGANSFECENAGTYAERYFYQALERRLGDTATLYASMPDTENVECTTQDVFTQGFFCGFLAAVADTDELHNEIELPTNANE